MHEITRIGRSNFRHSHVPIGIRQADRASHLYLLGQTGVGKTTLLEQLIAQDIEAGRGVALIDPHGDLYARLVARLGPSARERAILFDTTDPALAYGYNPVRRVRSDQIPLAASGLLETLKKLWPDAWGVRMEHILRNTLYLLMERRGSTLEDILRLYADKTFRKAAIATVSNDAVRAFWTQEFAHYPARFVAEALAPIRNKIGAFLADPLLRRILVHPAQDLRFRTFMDDGGILLVNLAKGRIGTDSSAILGSLLVSTLGLAAFSRTDCLPETRRHFHLYIDEFQNFTTLSLTGMMSELRKTGVSLTLAHQHLDQLDPQIRLAVFGNAGSMISFRVGAADAGVLAREFAPSFTAHDLINLPNRAFYIRLMIDGAPSLPFSAELLDRSDQPLVGPGMIAPNAN